MSVEDSKSVPSSDSSVRSDAVVNADNALRLLLGLLALWTLLSGLALVLFQGASEATTGGGLSGSEAHAAQRLLGVHMLVLAPIYALLAWEPRRFRLLLWVPYLALGLTLAVSLFDIVTGQRDFQDAALPFVVNLVFFALLVYVWRASRPLQWTDLLDTDARKSLGETSPSADSRPSEPLPESHMAAEPEERPTAS